ncbi:MAG TPA: cation:dicarboxylase symporter family transporter [Vitreimonas sp.]|uniref:dicarboxylate/amino acid:cation symporter n=1 Tax=Vitreimonas sp. TaxID=3069702 RepID=UPI002D23F1C7|nr:cation:dicarboxylase symporter family transporter [Vitreimonas sp.]HYD86427.1 cation:dicarboxylase symporter family transporter [Vitreimonas sp.]
MKSISLIVLAALIAGIVVGALVRAEAPQLAGAAGVVEAFGGLWLNALSMTVVPLVVSLLITGIASVADAAKTGGLVARAVLLFSVLIVFAAVFGIVVTQGLLALWPVDRDIAAGFIASVGAEAIVIEEPPSFVSWLQGLAPANPVSAAAENQILQLVVFAVFFGFAATKLPAQMRHQLVGFFRAVSEAMIVIVRWILLAGPLGVFALALGVGLRAGFGAAGTLVQYVVIVSAATFGITLVAWLIAVSWGRQPIARFTTAAAPVWAIAASTQSSLASLPAMLESALRGLRIPAHIADVVLPLAVAVFRFTSPVANLAVCFFVAHLYGVEPTLLQIAGAIVVAFGVSVGSVGLPGQISFIASIAPICMALGIPFELLGILLAVEVIPDIFRTLGNVTGDLAVTTVLARKQAREPAVQSVEAA